MRRSFLVTFAAAAAFLTACSVPVGETFAPFDAASTANAKVHKNCAFDTVDISLATASNAVKRSRPVEVSGWVTDDTLHTPTEFILVLTGPQAFARKVHIGVSRPDVAQVMGNPAAANSGYILKLDFAPVPVGNYAASAVLMTNAGPLVCQFNKSIVVTD